MLSTHDSSDNNPRTDKALGLEQEITRRDFLNATLLASGGLLMSANSPAHLLAQTPHTSTAPMTDDWTGYGGVGDYANSNGNTTEFLKLATRFAMVCLRAFPRASSTQANPMIASS